MNKTILVDIVHPAHVHFFRNSIGAWKNKGFKVIITARDKDITLQLLKNYNLSYILVSRFRKGLLFLAFEQIYRFFIFIGIFLKFRPNVITAISGISCTHASKLLGIPSIIFTDTESAKLSNLVNLPFADFIYTPEVFRKNLGSKHYRYKGFHEMAYISSYENFTKKNQVFLRFVSWGASHDILSANQTKIDYRQELLDFVLQQGYQLIISSEDKLPANMQKYQMKLPPEKVFNVLQESIIFIGESPTMAVEASLLGCKSILINAWAINEPNMQYLEKKFDLLKTFSDFNSSLSDIKSIFQNFDSESTHKNCRQFFKTHINVQSFISDRIEKEIG